MSEPTPPTVPTSSDACMTIVRSLMCYRMGGENESFSRRAIESLVKKLKEKRDELDSLITAITTNGAHQSKCVTIQRTLDGRLQVAGRKGFPHVIYAKIWRWSDLHRTELRHIKNCQFAFDLKCDSVCVNPYHYERVVSTGLDISEIDFQLNSETNKSPNSKDNDSNGNAETAIANINEKLSMLLEDDVEMTQTIQYHPAIQNSSSSSSQINTQELTKSYQTIGAPIPIVVEQQRYKTDTIINPNTKTVTITIDTSQLEIPPVQNQQSETYANKILPPTLFANTPQMSQISSTTKCQQYVQQYQNMNTVTTMPNIYKPTMPQNNTNTLSYTQRDIIKNDITLNNVRLLSNQPQPENWCSIAYFELDSQVGELFKVNSNYRTVNIDGYVDPSGGNRFCIGALSNVHRTEQSEKTRLHIGRGVILELHGEGDIWLKCESEHSVFVQSHFLDVQAGRASGNTVHKIYPSAYAKVFDLSKCYNHIKGQVLTAQAAARAQMAAVEGRLTHNPTIRKGFNAAAGIGVDDLRRLCILRLSFVKGWGPDYPRHTIKETPCWIEVHLHRALQLLDEILHAIPIKGSRGIE